MISRYTSRKGFALIVAMTLMAFILLLLMSLSALTRVEITSASISRSAQDARMNARLGLMSALGRLQQLAGPDRRATANAALLDVDATDTRYWTGVWDSATWDPQAPASGRFLGWLVSGDPATMDILDTYTNVPGETITIVGHTTTLPEYRVVVPLVEVSDAGGDTGGKYAFWISDESLKAKVNIDDPYERASQGDSDSERARVSIPQSLAIDLDERFSADADIWSGNWGKWSRIGNLDTLQLLASDFAPLLAEGENYDETFHNYTTEGYGLLVDTQRGGLRKNLTAGLGDSTIFNSKLANQRIVETDEVDSALVSGGADFFTPRWEMLRDYALLPETITGLQTNGHVIDTRQGALKDPDSLNDYYKSNRDSLGNLAGQLSPGNTSARLEPTMNDISVLTSRFSIFYRASAGAADGDGNYPIFLDVIPRITLWNPYNVPIKLSGEYVFQVQVKSTFTFTREGDSGPFFDGSLSDASGAERDYLWITLDTEDGLALADRVFYPGELKVFGLQAVSNVRVTGQSGRRRIIVGLAPYHNENAGIRFDVTGDAELKDTDNIILTWNTDAGFRHPNTPSYFMFFKTEDGVKSVIQNVDSFGLDAFDEDLEELASVSGLFAIPQELGGYDIRLKHAGEAHAGVPVVAAFNPRAYYSSVLADDYNDGEPLNWAVDILDSLDYSGYLDFENSPNGFVLRGRWGSDNDADGQSNVVLYGLPTGFPQGLAEFRHANLSYYANLPALTIGNSWANPHLDRRYVVGKSGGYTQMDLPWLLNTALWDKYFLTSLPVDNSDDTIRSLPNSRLVVTGGSASADDINSFDAAAAFLTIDGAFNVNSTSIKAWTALLGSLNAPDVDAYNPIERMGVEVDFERSSSRFDRPLSGPASADPEWFNGYWNLSEADIRDLATAMVDEVRERGPFLNLADFINRRLTNSDQGKAGALQAAIDEAGLNDGFINGYGLPDANAGFPYPANAPREQAAGMAGYLTQADILAAIGPLITTRGDTFRIVAYGKGPDSVDGQPGPEVYLQAVVQRVPDYVDSGVDRPETLPDELASDINREFGRQFRVVSVEWLQEAPL